MAKPALGRGLGALLGGNPIAKPQPSPPATLPEHGSPADTHERVERVALDRIRPGPFQPRKDFVPESLRELADSIKEQGIVQPLIVREHDGHLELIAGERRWRAAQMLGLAEVPVIRRQAADRAVLELALIENLQRENLNALEEAQGYSQLIEQFELTQEEVATKVGKSRAVVANALRLLKLPPEVQTCVRDGSISVGHAKVVLGLPGETEQTLAVRRILKEGLNVRQTESVVARMQSKPAAKSNTPETGRAADPHVARLEDQLRERLGTKIRLKYHQGKGALEIAFLAKLNLNEFFKSSESIRTEPGPVGSQFRHTFNQI